MLIVEVYAVEAVGRYNQRGVLGELANNDYEWIMKWMRTFILMMNIYHVIKSGHINEELTLTLPSVLAVMIRNSSAYSLPPIVT